MQYQQGSLGRTFLIKMEHGDPLLDKMQEFLGKEQVNQAVFWVIGALKTGFFVGGPRKCDIPPEPMGLYFDDGREILAFGTVYPDEFLAPSMHIHGVFGREKEVLAGCLRDHASVYLVVEVFLAELTGFDVKRIHDPQLLVRAMNLG